MHSKNTKNVKVEPLILRSYLAVIKRSIGSPIWQEFYASVNGKTTEVTRNGNVSCAWHITSILKMFSLVDTAQITVHRALDEMERCGWKKIARPRLGCIVIWGAQPADPERMKKDKNTYYPLTRHIGFYIGGGQTVTNDGRGTHKPQIKALTYRPVENFYWHRGLELHHSPIVWPSQVGTAKKKKRAAKKKSR
jgi:hypothetical protein